MVKLKHISEEYLQECVNSGHSGDPAHEDHVVNDLRKRINILAKHILKMQKSKTKLHFPKPIDPFNK